VRTSGSVRSNAGLSDTASILVLDADSSVDADTGEIVIGAPEPHLLHTVLVALNINHCMYTSHSHKTDLNKYRVLVECDYSREQLNATLDAIIASLHGMGVMLHNVPENRMWSQPWYFPRSAQPENYVFLSYVDGGALFASDPDISPRLASYPRKPAKLLMGQISPINAFNEHWKSPTRYLESVGYRWRGNRMIRQGSNTDKAGVMVCRECKDGIERVYSVGGDTLNCGFALDAFDCFAKLEHKGNFNQAITTTSKYFKVNGKPLWCFNNAIREQVKRFTELCKSLGEEQASRLFKQVFDGGTL
jgi:hypothetical protein